jgi:pyridoxal phosphate enzyme (YggS family)
MSRKNLINNALKELATELGDAKLIAVTKTYPTSDIQTAYEAGQREFGENKVQDLFDKATELANHKDIHWHFIGHLQTNKINKLLSVPNLVSIHSIDSIKLLNKLITKEPAKMIGLFLQINTSGEPEKGGFENWDELVQATQQIKDSKGFYLQGLMTIGKIRTENFEEDARGCFQQMQTYKHDFSQKLDLEGLELSMGMSQDYAIALKSGTDWVRIGSKIFGKRQN